MPAKDVTRCARHTAIAGKRAPTAVVSTLEIQADPQADPLLRHVIVLTPVVIPSQRHFPRQLLTHAQTGTVEAAFGFVALQGEVIVRAGC